MKKSLFLLLLVCTVSLRANTAVADPDLGNGRLVVCAQNLRNYYVTNTAQLDDVFNGKNGGLDGKTQRIVNTFLHLNADIYAVCEIEGQASTVAHLTDALNTAAGTTRYGYVSDPQESSERTQSAFIYRTDKVKPYRDNLAGSTDPYQYSHRMRIQTFEELSTGERFILSMNHFKAKEGANDDTDANRERNANDLLNKLGVITYDPDVLIMGDLNCTVSESPLQIILNAGYTEMLLEYNPDAYSHYYSGNELIDHALANSTLKAQIKGADVYHINTSSRKGDSNWYSDHDPVLVSLSLNANGDHPDNPDNPGEGEDCAIHYQADFKEGLGDFTVCTPQGSVSWNSNASYGAVINGYNKTAPMESWLISPAFDLSGADSATIAFRHNIYYDNTNGQYADYQTLWYTTDYDEASPASSDWHQLTIHDYAVKKYINTSVTLPTEALQNGFRFAFKYVAESSSAANFWEIDNVSLTSICSQGQSIEQTDAPDNQQQPRKFLQDGILYIQVGNTTYTLSGYLSR